MEPIQRKLMILLDTGTQKGAMNIVCQYMYKTIEGELQLIKCWKKSMCLRLKKNDLIGAIKICMQWLNCISMHLEKFGGQKKLFREFLEFKIVIALYIEIRWI